MDVVTELEIDRMGWGVYDESCYLCGKRMAIVATVHSVEHGYAEWFQPGNRLCQVCKQQVKRWDSA